MDEFLPFCISELSLSLLRPLPLQERPRGDHLRGEFTTNLGFRCLEGRNLRCVAEWSDLRMASTRSCPQKGSEHLTS